MTTYVLPAELGGGHIEADLLGISVAGQHVYKTKTEAGETRIHTEVELVEVRPPSIDDPVDLPLNIFSSESDASVHLEAEGAKTTLWVRVRGEFIKHAGGVFDYSDSALDLQVADLRDIARAAWQRANVLDGLHTEPQSGPIGIRARRPECDEAP